MRSVRIPSAPATSAASSLAGYGSSDAPMRTSYRFSSSSIAGGGTGCVTTTSIPLLWFSDRRDGGFLHPACEQDRHRDRRDHQEGDERDPECRRRSRAADGCTPLWTEHAVRGWLKERLLAYLAAGGRSHVEHQPHGDHQAPRNYQSSQPFLARQPHFR